MGEATTRWEAVGAVQPRAERRFSAARFCLATEQSFVQWETEVGWKVQVRGGPGASGEASRLWDEAKDRGS